MKRKQDVNPPSCFSDCLWTLPPTDEKRFFRARRVLQLFTDIRAGKQVARDPWTEFQLAEGKYDEIVYLLSQDEELLGFIQDKIR